MEDNPGKQVKEKIKLKKRVSSLLEESALPTSKDGSMIQSDDIPNEVAKVKVNKQVKLTHDNNGQIKVSNYSTFNLRDCITIRNI